MLPRGLSKVSARTGTPIATTLFTAVLVAALAGVARLDEIAALANAGTLAAFTAVGLCLVVLRVREPGRVRKFRTPLAFIVGPLAVIGCGAIGREVADLAALAPQKRGPKADPARIDALQIAQLTRERDKLRVELGKAQLVIEVQKKVAALLEQLDPLQKFASP